MYWNLFSVASQRAYEPSWIVTLDVLKFGLFVFVVMYYPRWIVTLDVLK